VEDPHDHTRTNDIAAVQRSLAENAMTFQRAATAALSSPAMQARLAETTMTLQRAATAALSSPAMQARLAETTMTLQRAATAALSSPAMQARLAEIAMAAQKALAVLLQAAEQSGFGRSFGRQRLGSEDRQNDEAATDELAPVNRTLVRDVVATIVFAYTFVLLVHVYLQFRDVLDPFATIFDASPVAGAWYVTKWFRREFDQRFGS
jgi:hypothetical protein